MPLGKSIVKPKKSVCNKLCQTDLDIMAFDGPKNNFETFGPGFAGADSGGAKKWTKFEEFCGTAMERLENFLNQLLEVEKRISGLKNAFFRKIDGFVGSENYRSMETEMRGHIDILSFNLDRWLKDSKKLIGVMRKVDLEIGGELRSLKSLVGKSEGSPRERVKAKVEGRRVLGEVVERDRGVWSAGVRGRAGIPEQIIKNIFEKENFM